MVARSTGRQQLVLAKETTPGVAATTGFKRVESLRATIGHTIEGEDFKASGSKVNTARVTNSELATVGLESILDYNGAIWPATGGFGLPVSTVGSGPTAGTTSHLFSLNPYAADPKVTFTGFWGDATLALMLRHLIFQTFGFTIQRGSLSLETSAIAYFPESGTPFPSSGDITTVTTRTMAGRQFDIFMDTSWDGLGTTKLLAAYEGGMTFGDKHAPDWVINSSVPSFSETIEAEDTEYSAALRLGFDSVSIGMVNRLKAGDLVFVRIKSVGPVIAGAIPYSFQQDLCLRVTNIGEYGAAPSSPAISVPFDLTLAVDPVSGKTAELTIVNAIAGL